MTNIYQFRADTIHGEEISLQDYQGKVLLIVNTASKCGFTPQFSGLEKLYQTYQQQGFYVLGFPCNQFAYQDPADNTEIELFCQRNYGVSFPMFAKIDVKGEDAHPLFRYLTQHSKGLINQGIKWNFTKFLVGRDGTILGRYAPMTKPENLMEDIEKALKNHIR